MNGLVWQERLNIGVEELDNDHKKLYSIMNKLIELCSDETTSQFGCQEAMRHLKKYSSEHFAREEAYMRSINYSGYDIHKRLHDNFRTKTLPSLEKELERTNYSMDAIRHFTGVYIGWLTGHTMTEDQAITGKSTSKWENVPPEEEKAALENTILRLLKEIFDLDAQTISEYYNGEDFGNGIHHYLLYHSQKGEEREFTLIYEDKLLLNTINNILGCSLHKVDDMVMNATRYITRHFLNHIRETFPAIDLYEVKEESLLSHEQFMKINDKERPRYSFLFDTGSGYLAMCLMLPQVENIHLSHAFSEEEAIDNIKKFLQRKSKQKKKILIVDDSSIIRHSMEKLLCDDYEITLANSGMAAIKCIALDKPDLILMDYEMPVCDGRQTLAMIRSDREIANIPVIFLTGRGDKASIMNVMSLNPAGYLLKSTKQPDIKKKIDDFFEKED